MLMGFAYTSCTPDKEISHRLTEEELDDLAVSDSRAFDDVRRGVRHGQVIKLLFGQAIGDLWIWRTAGGMHDVQAKALMK